jgi:hypothetical protein
MNDQAMNEQLKQMMNADQYQTLMAAVATHVARAREEGRQQGAQAAAGGSLLRGVLKSWSIWLGGLLLTFPDWWPLIAAEVQPLVSERAWETATRLTAVAVILLRFKTTQSLAEKSIKPAPATQPAN